MTLLNPSVLARWSNWIFPTLQLFLIIWPSKLNFRLSMYKEHQSLTPFVCCWDPSSRLWLTASFLICLHQVGWPHSSSSSFWTLFFYQRILPYCIDGCVTGAIVHVLLGIHKCMCKLLFVICQIATFFRTTYVLLFYKRTKLIVTQDQVIWAIKLVSLTDIPHLVYSHHLKYSLELSVVLGHS